MLTANGLRALTLNTPHPPAAEESLAVTTKTASVSYSEWTLRLRAQNTGLATANQAESISWALERRAQEQAGPAEPRRAAAGESGRSTTPEQQGAPPARGVWGYVVGRMGRGLTVNRTKYFWLFSPTQLLTQGQWWSIFRMHRLQTLKQPTRPTVRGVLAVAGGPTGNADPLWLRSSQVASC